jgi:uncharacterized protein
LARFVAAGGCARDPIFSESIHVIWWLYKVMTVAWSGNDVNQQEFKFLAEKHRVCSTRWRSRSCGERNMKKMPDYTGASRVVVMAPKSYLALEMTKGQVLRIEDMEGCQCADIAFINRQDYLEKKKSAEGGAIAQSLIEQYSQAMTANRNRHVYLGKGFPLYSSLCRKIMTITQDTVGHHDVIVAWCNPELNYSRWGEIAVGKRTCKENIRDALAPYGILVDLPFTFNIFMDYTIGEDGVITYGKTLSEARDYIDLKAEMDVIVAISNCPQELSLVNGFNPTRLRVAVFESGEYMKVEPDAQMDAIEVNSMAAIQRQA